MTLSPDGPGPRRVLVTGATSEVGAEVLRRLVADGIEVRGMHRRSSQRQNIADAGAQPVLADFDDADSLRLAMAGCTDVLLITPPLQGQLEKERRAIDSAVAAGVTRVVRLSASDSNRGAAVPWAKAHAWADHYLADSGLEWTVLRPSGFMQNLTASAPTIRHGFLPQASGKGELPLVDVIDIAAVAHRVLTTDGHEHATYLITGPESLTMAQVADKLTAHLHRKVRFVSLPGWVYAVFLRMTGSSWWKANGLRMQFADVVKHGHDIDVTAEVERLTGRPARSLDDFLRQNKAMFVG